MIIGVTRYPGRCDFSNDGDVDDSGKVESSQYNVLFWIIGDWDGEIDPLTVSFRTENDEAPLRFANADEGSEVALQISSIVMNVNSGLQFYVLGNSTQFCALDYECQTPGSQYWYWLICLIGWPVFILCISTWVCWNRGYCNDCGDDGGGGFSGVGFSSGGGGGAG